jgi:hypothetical protein
LDTSVGGRKELKQDGGSNQHHQNQQQGTLFSVQVLDHQHDGGGNQETDHHIDNSTSTCLPGGAAVQFLYSKRARLFFRADLDGSLR